MAPPPRVVIISPDQWFRAGLRAELREDGIDAAGARDVPEALIAGQVDRQRGPVRLLVVDHDALGNELDTGMLARVRRRFEEPATILVAHATRQSPPGPWSLVLTRPVTIGDIVEAVKRLLPEPPAAGPLEG